jgi:hypothetical protein
MYKGYSMKKSGSMQDLNNRTPGSKLPYIFTVVLTITLKTKFHIFNRANKLPRHVKP